MGQNLGKDKHFNLDPNRLTLDHFEKLRVIGRGAFGKVHAVSRRDTKILYAMKVLDKTEIVEQKMITNVMNERGDMRYHMRNDKHFEEERVRFYVAQTALCLNYLHTNGYVHRDIKPDNLLMDGEGNCHLTDFNLSVKLTAGGIKGVAGTRPYMAPEVVSKEYYGFEIDWWSLGVMTYEMCFGKLPFVGDKNQLTDAILNTEPKYPSNADPNIVAICKGLMCKDPIKRWGFKNLKLAKWFEGLDWDKLEQKQLPTPWQPDQNRANCDGSFDLDEQFEVKKKRYPLAPEKDELLSEWDYQPGYSRNETQTALGASEVDSNTSKEENNGHKRSTSSKRISKRTSSKRTDSAKSDSGSVSGSTESSTEGAPKKPTNAKRKSKKLAKSDSETEDSEGSAKKPGKGKPAESDSESTSEAHIKITKQRHGSGTPTKAQGKKANGKTKATDSDNTEEKPKKKGPVKNPSDSGLAGSSSSSNMRTTKKKKKATAVAAGSDSD